MTREPKPLPMPVELVLDSKHLKCCIGTVERAVIAITCRFWAAGCSPMPFSAVAAREVAKLDGGAWTRSEAAIMAALADLLPALARAYSITQSRKANMKFVLGKISADTRAARYQSAKPKTESKPEIKKPSHNPMPLVTPAHAQPFKSDGRMHLSPQQLAAMGKAEKNEIARLSDK